MPFRKLLFVDLETTGANPVEDRITEIGIVCVEDGKASHWSSLVNPQTAIPSFIQGLTGINDAMVGNAPVFETLAADVLARLSDGLFVAHNARFDYGFLRNAFKRMGIVLQSEVLCSVKLSRKLYPGEKRHGLATLIERHNLSAQARHRALADADVLWQFWQKAQQDVPRETFVATVRGLLQSPSTAQQSDPGILGDIPNKCGVYTLYGDNAIALYVGKSIHMRKHAQTHFQETQRRKAGSFGHLVKYVEWQECAGDIGAALLEAKLLKQFKPVHNRLLRESGLCSWQMNVDPTGKMVARLVAATEQDFAQAEGLHGLFRSRKKAEAEIRQLAEINKLCMVSMGLECALAANQSCKAYRSQACHGVCIGKESPERHQERLSSVLSDMAVQRWPYDGAIALAEPQSNGGPRTMHCVKNWSYVGSAETGEQLQVLLDQATGPARFDLDIYKIVSRALALGLVETIEIIER